MRVLVTGATGFVGRHLAHLLLSRRVEAFGTYLQPDFGDLPDKIKLLKCDVRKADQVLRVARDVRPQQVFHLAALSSVRGSFDDTKSVYEANFLGTLNLLEAVHAAQPSARVLIVSSGQCYGRVKPSHVPVSETEPLAPDSPYGVSKAAGEMLAKQFFLNYGLHVICARPFNHTGPGQSSEFICSDWARQFAEIDLKLRPPTLCVGNLASCRDFSDVRDVVHAYCLLLRKGKSGEAYNVGSGRAVSLRKIMAILRSLCARDVRIEVDQRRMRPGEVNTIFPDTKKLRAATNWEPKFDLTTTLRDLFDYWKETLKNNPRFRGRV